MGAREKAIRVFGAQSRRGPAPDIAGTAGSTKRYLNIELPVDERSPAAQPKPNVRDYSGHYRP